MEKIYRRNKAIGVKLDEKIYFEFKRLCCHQLGFRAVERIRLLIHEDIKRQKELNRILEIKK